MAKGEGRRAKSPSSFALLPSPFYKRLFLLRQELSRIEVLGGNPIEFGHAEALQLFGSHRVGEHGTFDLPFPSLDLPAGPPVGVTVRRERDPLWITPPLFSTPTDFE